MISLLIETATERSVVALMQGNEPLYRYDLPFGYSNSKYLLTHVEQALNLADGKVSLIVAGIGPGSYTGMRVGAITAKTLSYASKIPLVGVCSLVGFTPESDCSFAAIVDAKIGGAYLLQGTKVGGVITFEATPTVCEIERLGPMLEGVSVLVTPKQDPLKARIDAAYPNNRWKWEEKAPDPITMMQAGIAHYQSGVYTVDGKLDLHYLRDWAVSRSRGKD